MTAFEKGAVARQYPMSEMAEAIVDACGANMAAEMRA